jgi:hypothetical protein
MFNRAARARSWVALAVTMNGQQHGMVAPAPSAVKHPGAVYQRVGACADGDQVPVPVKKDPHPIAKSDIPYLRRRKDKSDNAPSAITTLAGSGTAAPT